LHPGNPGSSRMRKRDFFVWTFGGVCFLTASLFVQINYHFWTRTESPVDKDGNQFFHGMVQGKGGEPCAWYHHDGIREKPCCYHDNESWVDPCSTNSAASMTDKETCRGGPKTNLKAPKIWMLDDFCFIYIEETQPQDSGRWEGCMPANSPPQTTIHYHYQCFWCWSEIHAYVIGFIACVLILCALLIVGFNYELWTNG